jgi:peptidoglycan/LPS O-acetylase OafA/YrhL
MVVAYHCGITGFSGGFVGVDVFFVLSGYLITGLLVTEVLKTSRLSLLNFYSRRIRRLLPASALVLLATLIVASIIFAPSELVFTARAARATSVYLSNLFFAINAADYFAPDVAANPFLHTWTLAVEEQFYLLWPILIIFALQFLRSMKVLVIMLIVLIALSLVTSIYYTDHGGVFAFYGLPARIWEFGLGALAVLLPGATLKISPAGCSILGWLGLAVILASGYFITSDLGFPGWIALVPVLGTVAVLAACAQQPSRGVAYLLDTAPLQFLGSVSYTWYLWHWPFLMFSAALFPGISVLGNTIAAAASLLVASFTHRFIENPIRFHPSLALHRGRTFALATVITAVSLVAAFLTLRVTDDLLNAPDLKTLTAAVGTNGPPLECVSLGESPDVKSCEFGNTSSPVNLVLFGDSHAMQWFDPLRRIADSRAWRLTTFVKSGCPSAQISPPDTAGFREACAIWQKEVIHQIVAMSGGGYSGKVVVILGSATVYLQGTRKPVSRLDVTLDAWREGNRRTFAAFASGGLHVLAIRDTPTPPFDVPTCLARAVRNAWYAETRCDFDRKAAEHLSAFEVQKAAAAPLPNITFLDATNALCDKDVCPVIRKGMVVYRDSSHMTRGFSASLAPLLEANLVSILDASY